MTELQENMCRVMAERQFWTRQSLAARLDDLGWLPENADADSSNPVLADNSRVIGNMLAIFGDLFERVNTNAHSCPVYRLAKECVAALYSPTDALGMLDVESEPAPTQWERLLGGQTFDPDSLRESDEAAPIDWSAVEWIDD